MQIFIKRPLFCRSTPPAILVALLQLGNASRAPINAAFKNSAACGVKFFPHAAPLIS